jgi:hypothetical protein
MTIAAKEPSVIFKNDTCKIYHEEKDLIMSAHMSLNIMYVIKALVIIRQCLTTSQKNDAQLWHQRYGHLSSKGINVLVQKGTVHGLPSVKESNTKCANCMKGKQQREVFPKKSSRRASIKLELIHFDICGPINLESNEKKRYFITSTDDLTMKTWI